MCRVSTSRKEQDKKQPSLQTPLHLFLLIGILIMISACEQTILVKDTNYLYGEMYGKNDTGFVIVNVATVDTYYQVTNLTAGLLNGTTVTNSNMTVQQAGVYKIDLASSISAGEVSEYGLKVYLNGVGQDKCYAHSHLTIGHTSSMGITCLLTIETNGVLSVRIDDHVNPPNNPTIYSMNINALRIGN